MLVGRNDRKAESYRYPCHFNDAELKVENTFGENSAADEIAQGECVASQPAPTVYVGLGPDRSHNVHGEITRNVTDRSPERIAATLADEVQRVGDLRVAKPDARSAPDLGPKMHAPRGLKLHYVAKGSNLAGQIDVFLPPVQRQAFVEPQSVPAHRCQPDRHVAPVGREYRPNAVPVHVIACQDCQPLGNRKTRSVDAVRNDHAGHYDGAGICRHVRFNRRQITRLRQEVVIKEHQDIGASSGRDDRIALTRQASRGEQDVRVWSHRCHTTDVRCRGSADDDLVRYTGLPAKLSQRLAQDTRPADRWKAHGDFYSVHRFYFAPECLAALRRRHACTVSEK
jgi:hypothetical protein